MVADMALGAYRIHLAEGDLPDPLWPAKTLPELLKLAFKGRIVDSIDHPVVRRLRGLTDFLSRSVGLRFRIPR